MTIQMQHEGVGGAMLPATVGGSIAAPAPRTITIGGRAVPVVGPSARDPRLHLALVIVSVIVIGTTLIDFRLSIPQIVITVVVCAGVEMTHRLVTTGVLVWPASGMQTATSTVLVLRVVGVEHGDWMSFEGLHWMVGVAVLGLLSKYVIRTATGHVFNPSNVALVVAFLVLGAERIEPLDYWWGAFDWRLALVYGVIIVGGITICGRLGVLAMAISFWITLAVGVGVLAALGHSMTTRWSFAPVEQWHLWRTIVLSPETMIFFLFMVTDPRTTPQGRRTRVLFGVLVGVLSTLFLAPWPTEFGSKVGLLAGLTVASLLRYPLERFVAARGTEHARTGPRSVSRPVAALACGVGVLVFGASAALAGAPNRATDRVDAAGAVTVARVAAASSAAGVEVEGRLPEIDIAADVAALSADLATQIGARGLVDALIFNLGVEAEALALGDASLLGAVDHGARLVDVTERVESADGGRHVWSVFRLVTIELDVVFPGGLQSGPNAGLRLVGSVSDTVISGDGAPGVPVERPIDTTYTMRRTPSGVWLTTGTVASG
jgi:hypothetical protein